MIEASVFRGWACRYYLLKYVEVLCGMPMNAPVLLIECHPHLGMHPQQQIPEPHWWAIDDEEDVKPLEVLGSRKAMSCGVAFEFPSCPVGSCCQAGIELGTLKITGLCTDEVSGTRRKGDLRWMRKLVEWKRSLNQF